MAITKSSKIERVTVKFFTEVPDIEVETVTTWDDPDDDQLPMDRRSSRTISKMVLSTTYEEDGTPIHSETERDMSGEDQLVQDIAAVVWA